MKIINTTNAPAPIGPYSQAVLHGNTLYVSGQIALHPKTGELNMADLKTETTQVFDNIKAILTEAGLTLNNVIKCSIFLSNMNDFGEINGYYGEQFGDHKPARECVQVACLPKNVNVEITVIAGK